MRQATRIEKKIQNVLAPAAAATISNRCAIRSANSKRPRKDQSFSNEQIDLQFFKIHFATRYLATSQRGIQWRHKLNIDHKFKTCALQHRANETFSVSNAGSRRRSSAASALCRSIGRLVGMRNFATQTKIVRLRRFRISTIILKRKNMKFVMCPVFLQVNVRSRDLRFFTGFNFDAHCRCQRKPTTHKK